MYRTLLLCVAMSAGCSFVGQNGHTDMSTKASELRLLAMRQFMNGEKSLALSTHRQALRVARQLPPTHMDVVENYDDAGLFYFDAGRWRDAARRQAIAVLLACAGGDTDEVYSVYLQRLRLTLEKYPVATPIDVAIREPLRLLDDEQLNLRDNFDIRRRFYRVFPSGGPRIVAAMPTYRLKREWQNATCKPRRKY